MPSLRRDEVDGDETKEWSMSPGEPYLLLLLLLLEGTELPREMAVNSLLTPPPNHLATAPDKNSCLNRLVTQLKGPRRDTTTFQILD